MDTSYSHHLNPLAEHRAQTERGRLLRAVVVEDALCSSSDAGHDALMTIYRNRFSEQIELIKTEDLATCGATDFACRQRGDQGWPDPPAAP
jgi:hypothetical protein